MKNIKYTCKKCGKTVKKTISTTGDDMMASKKLCTSCCVVKIKEEKQK